MKQSKELLLLIVAGLTLFIVHSARPSLIYRAIEFGGSSADVGLVGGAYGLLAVVFALRIGRHVDRWGALRPLSFAIPTLGLACLCGLFAESLWGLVASASLFGLGHVLVAISVQAALGAETRLWHRDRSFSRLTVLASVTGVIGPILAGYLVAADMRVEGRSASTSVLALLILFVLFIPAPVLRLRALGVDTRRSSKTLGPVEIAKTMDGVRSKRRFWTGIGVSFIVLTASDVFVVYLPVIGTERGIGPEQIGFLLAMRSLAGVFSRVLVPRFRIRFSSVQLLSVSVSAAGFAFVGLAFAGNFVQLAVLGGILGFCLGIGTPLTLSIVADSVTSESRARAFSMRLMGNRLGQVVIPPLAGIVGVLLGTGSVFVFAAVTTIGVGLLLPRVART